MDKKKSFPMPAMDQISSEPETKQGKILNDAVKKRAIQKFIETGSIVESDKKQISLVLPSDLLLMVDESAFQLGMSRASYIKAVLTLSVQSGLDIVQKRTKKKTPGKSSKK